MGRTFCIGEHFVCEDILYRRTFCCEGRFVEGCFVEGRFVGRTFWRGGRCVVGRFVLASCINLHSVYITFGFLLLPGLDYSGKSLQ